MAVCVFLCAVAGPWFSIFGRSGGLFKVMQLGINFNDFMGYYMLSSGNGIGVIVVLVAWDYSPALRRERSGVYHVGCEHYQG